MNNWVLEWYDPIRGGWFARPGTDWITTYRAFQRWRQYTGWPARITRDGIVMVN